MQFGCLPAMLTILFNRQMIRKNPMIRKNWKNLMIRKNWKNLMIRKNWKNPMIRKNWKNLMIRKNWKIPMESTSLLAW